MSINTNGFITEYVKAVQNKEWLIKTSRRDGRSRNENK